MMSVTNTVAQLKRNKFTVVAAFYVFDTGWKNLHEDVWTTSEGVIKC